MGNKADVVDGREDAAVSQDIMEGLAASVALEIHIVSVKDSYNLFSLLKQHIFYRIVSIFEEESAYFLLEIQSDSVEGVNVQGW